MKHEAYHVAQDSFIDSVMSKEVLGLDLKENPIKYGALCLTYYLSST